MSRIDIDGNAYALRQYEADLDRLQALDDELEEIENEIWESDKLLLEAVRAADSMDTIETAVEAHTKRVQERRHAEQDDY
jgi:hypothetical protein